MPSDSAFISPHDFNNSWSNITLLEERKHNALYTAQRYGRTFILKTLRAGYAHISEYRLAQEKEFRLGISLSHPNIAATYSLEELPEIGRCIVEEYIDGLTLNKWLQTKPSSTSLRRVADQLLDAVEYLHSLQKVHHDLKPSNVLVTRNGQNVKLIDFGLSDTDDSLTSQGNDPREDIRRLAPLLRLLFPHRYALVCRRCEAGRYPNIAALRRAMQRRRNLLRWMPVLLSVLLLLLSVVMLNSTHRQVEETQAALNHSIDTAEIRAVLDSIYRPVYDSLLRPDTRYSEIASYYRAFLPKPMPVYQRMVARYPLGSVQYAAFSEAWLAVYNQINADISARMDSMPSFYKDYQAGIISAEERMRQEERMKGIASRHQ